MVIVVTEKRGGNERRMTREEAVEKLEAFAPMVVDDTREAIDMAIEALQREEHLVELEINGERYTVSAEEITRAIYNASNGGR